MLCGGGPGCSKGAVPWQQTASNRWDPSQRNARRHRPGGLSWPASLLSYPCTWRLQAPTALVMPPLIVKQSLRRHSSPVAKFMRRSARAAVARWVAGRQATASQSRLSLGRRKEELVSHRCSLPRYPRDFRWWLRGVRTVFRMVVDWEGSQRESGSGSLSWAHLNSWVESSLWGFALPDICWVCQADLLTQLSTPAMICVLHSFLWA